MRIHVIVAGLMVGLALLSSNCSWQAAAFQQKLDARIPEADPAKYKAVRENSPYLNPKLAITRDGVDLLLPSGRQSIRIAVLRQTLVKLPVSAWPYGRVIFVSDNGLRNGDGSDEEPIRRNHQAVEAILKELGITADWWPSA